MRYFLFAALMGGCCLSATAQDRPTLLITPAGVFQVDYVNDVPQAPKPVDFDVVIRGFDTGTPIPPKPPTDPPPPVDDSTVQAVRALTQSTLKDRQEATAVVALVDMLAKNGVKGAEFVEALSLGAKIFDGSMNAGGRITKWSADVVKVTTDPAKIMAGASSAFGTLNSDIAAISRSVQSGDITAEALDFAKIIEILMVVLDLLRRLGIIT